MVESEDSAVLLESVVIDDVDARLEKMAVS